MSTGRSYWTKSAISRRKALQAAAAASGGLAALSLAGCGGSGGSKSPAATGSTTPVTDATKGIPGGTLKFALSSYPANFGTITLSNNHTIGGMVHSSLLMSKWGQPSVGTREYYNLEGDLAQSLPEQPDTSTLVFKLRPGVKFHNGKPLTSEDVRYTYDRLANLDRSAYRVRYQSWFDRVETPDANTVVLKTKFPYADALIATAGIRDGYIVSKEHEEGPDAIANMMGSGPFVWVSTTPPVTISFRKNPDYYRAPFPYFDQVQAYIYSDAVKRDADFIAGQTDLPWFVHEEERDQIKRERPTAIVETWESWGQSIFWRADKPPFNDKRVRQAFSMTMDRKKLREVASKGEGRDDQWLSVVYKDILGSREPKDLGAAAKYWNFDPAEAKKLLSAAGIDKPIETTSTHHDASVFGQYFADIAVASEAGWKELGVANIKDNPVSGAQFSTTAGVSNYDGMGQTITGGIDANGAAFTLAIRDSWYWGPNGEHSANYNMCYVNNTQLSQLVDKQAQQLKMEDRQQTYRAMEDILAEEQYRPAFSTGSSAMAWNPNLRNARMPPEQCGRSFLMRWWFDKA